MWVLWLILVWPSMPGEHPLHSLHDTYEACVVERDRMTREFEKSYPGDHDYQFVCRYKARGV